MRYYGAKWRLAPAILPYFPSHACYVEPFGGAAGVLLRKPPSPVEVYNDADGMVVNFFRVLRDHPRALRRSIELTPYSRAEVDRAYAAWDSETDPLERARIFYVMSWQQRHGVRGPNRHGWRFTRGANQRNPLDQWGSASHLLAVARRLRDVQIECDDGLAVIGRYDSPDTLFYCDPPYLAQTRSSRWGQAGYAHEMGEEDHRALAGALCKVKGMVVLSGYPSALYDDLYPEWGVVNLKGLDALGKARPEQLWLSPSLVRRLGAPVQVTFWQLLDGGEERGMIGLDEKKTPQAG